MPAYGLHPLGAMRPWLLLLALSVPACATDSDGPIPDRRSRGREQSGGAREPSQRLPVPAEPNFVLYVSNQSFELDPVDIEVTLDGELAVEGDFLVEGQHSWHMFKFKLRPGPRTLRVASEVGDTRLTETIEIAGATRYAVINFWYYGGHEPYGPAFSLDLYDVPPGFD